MGHGKPQNPPGVKVKGTVGGVLLLNNGKKYEKVVHERCVFCGHGEEVYRNKDNKSYLCTACRFSWKYEWVAESCHAARAIKEFEAEREDGGREPLQ